ncbi:tetratricopeptide repeat protein [Candidatus Poribacteria bacterium]|nr:tetratricopeptide repeat protein [Candidatus Poribacteria bacterium]
MSVLEMTDSELYEMGIKVLTDKLGVSEVPRFIRQCQPGKGNYAVDRHKLLADQPDIDTIVKRIQDRVTAREIEERARAERFAAPQSEIRKMTDIEICEIGNQVLMNKLGADGLMRFIGQCQELNGGYTRGLIKNREEAQEYIKLYTASLTFNPKIVEDYIKRGNAYSYIGEHDKAIADYDQAIKLKPNYAKAYCHRGVAHCKKHEYDKAIKDYNEVIKREPDYAEAYGARGEAWLHLKEWERAKADLIFAKGKDFDIIASFRKSYENVADFEQRNGVQFPEDIKAMLTQQ